MKSEINTSRRYNLDYSQHIIEDPASFRAIMLAIKEPAQCTYKTKDTEKIGKEFTTERRVVRDLPASSWITPLD